MVRLHTTKEDMLMRYSRSQSAGKSLQQQQPHGGVSGVRTLLADVVRKTWQLQVLRDAEGRIFIDRSPALFHHVLEFLRNPSAPIEGIKPEQEKAFKRELVYYGLEALVFEGDFRRTPCFWHEVELTDDSVFELDCEYAVLVCTECRGCEQSHPESSRKFTSVQSCGHVHTLADSLGATKSRTMATTNTWSIFPTIITKLEFSSALIRLNWPSSLSVLLHCLLWNLALGGGAKARKRSARENAKRKNATLVSEE